MTVRTAISKTGMPERSAARLAAVQALYQMEHGGAGVEAVIDEFVEHRLGQAPEGEIAQEADVGFFADIARGVVEAQRRIEMPSSVTGTFTGDTAEFERSLASSKRH